MIVQLSELDRYLLHICGVLFAVALPVGLLRRIQDDLWRTVLLHNNVPERLLQRDLRLLAVLIGALERALYFGSILVGQHAFIGVWLALKAAGGWKGWSEGRPFSWRLRRGTIVKTVPGAQVFNAHLVGVALSLLVAATGAYSVKWALEAKYLIALAVSLATLIATIALSAYVSGHVRTMRVRSRAT